MAIREHGLYRRCARPAADVAKGGCYITGDAGVGVDTGAYIDMEGTLYLSLNTIKELAEVAGFSVNEEGQQLEIDNTFLTEQVASLGRELADANEQLEAVGLAVARAASKGK